MNQLIIASIIGGLLTIKIIQQKIKISELKDDIECLKYDISSLNKDLIRERKYSKELEK